MHRKLFHLSLIVLVAASAVAQQRRVEQGAPSAERLRAHVTYLASDKLEGRRTGTAGAEAAASYIAEEFGRYKLRPGVISQSEKHPSVLNATYAQPFPFVASVELGKNNSMLLTPSAALSNGPQQARAASLDLRLNEDWKPLGFSLNARMESVPAAFAGYGITAADLSYNDYAGVDVKGRIVIAFADTPDGDNPHGEFARYADARWRAIAARDHGAKALVLIVREENFRADRLTRLHYDNSTGDAGLPVVAISRQAAQRIFAAAGLAPLAELEQALRARRSTASRAATTDASSSSQSLSAPLQNITLSLNTEIVRRNVPASNVIGVIEGSDPKLRNEAIVIGAHYDHLGLGGEGSLAQREGGIHHGADDNASGTAGLLELARLFSAEREKIRRTIIFIAFSGEEEGLIGSNFYVNHPVVPLAQTVAMINMDMIGRMRERKLLIGGVGTAQQWRRWISAANLVKGVQSAASDNAQRAAQRGAGLPATAVAGHGGVITIDPTQQFALTLNEDGYGPSDHSSFYAKQIPVLFFFTGTHEDYHKPSDTADKINYEDQARLLSFIAEIVRSIDAEDRRPVFTTARSEGMRRSMGFRVYLGTIPSYAESTGGLKLDGVRDDSPAAKAGLRPGDLIVKLAGREIRNVYDYTYALGEMKAGEEYEVEIIRAGAHLKLKITPAPRK